LRALRREPWVRCGELRADRSRQRVGCGELRIGRGKLRARRRRQRVGCGELRISACDELRAGLRNLWLLWIDRPGASCECGWHINRLSTFRRVKAWKWAKLLHDFLVTFLSNWPGKRSTRGQGKRDFSIPCMATFLPSQVRCQIMSSFTITRKEST
jgi:hypothetical protein